MIEWPPDDATTDVDDDPYPVSGTGIVAEHSENDRPGGGGAGAIFFLVFLAIDLAALIAFITLLR